MSRRASIVIPVLNGKRFLRACLDALLPQVSSDSEVIVVDNGSADGSADFVADNYPTVRLIRNKCNLGFGGACNIGLKAGKGDILILLNVDTRVREGWLSTLTEALQKHEVGVAGCKILYPDGKTIQHAGGWIEWPLGLAHHYGQGEQDTGQWDSPQQVEFVTGAAFAFRRDVMEQVGFLDEGFFPIYFEDTDYCFRVREAGYQIHYLPDSILEHFESTSLTNTTLSMRYQRGRLRFLLKHLSPERFLEKFVPAEEAYQPPAAMGKEGIPLHMAYLEAIYTAPSILRQRWSADEDTVQGVIAALQHLHQRVWEEKWAEVSESIPSIGNETTLDTEGSRPSLVEEFEFSSTVPIIGPLIARLRSLWYGVAARWAVRHMAQQQELYIRSLAKRIEALSAENAYLIQELADLKQHLDSCEE